MESSVVITVTKGPLKGQTLSFDGRTSCLLGRGLDCSFILPDDSYHRTISRNHCLLDINPPDIRVRDFGSLNGTYVNEHKIGQRESGKGAGATTRTPFPERDLHNGDIIRLGGTEMEVTIITPDRCSHCGRKLPPSDATLPRLCAICAEAETDPGDSHHHGTGVSKKRRCSLCGNDVSGEANPFRDGDYLCAECREEPEELVVRIIEEANEGESALAPIAGYSLIRELGRGGMGAVSLCRHNETGELVALKMMLPEVATDEAARDLFLREAKNSRALDHPNVVTLIDAGYGDGLFFMTLEYCDGGSVDQLMDAQGGRLPRELATHIVMQALDGLIYIHEAPITLTTTDGSERTAKGLVHRDIKPANIFLSGPENNLVAKLADVGLAKAFDLAGLSGQTRTGSVIGTPFFMPRQQVVNFKYAQPDVDVWAMAATYYTMLTGALPRDFPATKDPWQTVLQDKPVPIQDRDESIPEKLAAVIDMALIDQPEILFTSAADFKEALCNAL